MILFNFRLLGGENATECSGLWFLTCALASVFALGIIGPLFDILKDYRYQLIFHGTGNCR